ncbi:1667_t:CDS:2 [Scutellospora calospora]|uniref:1667_t:CDS:1 n=1 Tax=Scutellospora calospora TaxID=85575 RepID=A0ACA9KIC7_9GLOM|nr:1667_t:CDS:2 [Scutellospora calospora]
MWQKQLRDDETATKGQEFSFHTLLEVYKLIDLTPSEVEELVDEWR